MAVPTHHGLFVRPTDRGSVGLCVPHTTIARKQNRDSRLDWYFWCLPERYLNSDVRSSALLDLTSEFRFTPRDAYIDKDMHAMW